METNVTLSKETGKQSYYDVKSNLLKNSNSIRLYGIPIDNSSEPIFNINKLKGDFFGIYDWCFCNQVHDTPNNPCPCMKNTILWIPIKHLSSSGIDAEKKEYYFDIEKEANLQIESLRSVKASEITVDGNLKESLNSISRPFGTYQSLHDLIEKLLRTLPTFPIPEEEPGIAEMSVKGFLGSFGKLIAAFEAGYTFGTEIDKKTDLSGLIADALCKLTDCDK
jgi:hypothetical protein